MALQLRTLIYSGFENNLAAASRWVCDGRLEGTGDNCQLPDKPLQRLAIDTDLTLGELLQCYYQSLENDQETFDATRC